MAITSGELENKGKLSLFQGFEGQTTYTDTTFGNCDNGTVFEFFDVFGDNVLEVQIDPVRAHVAQPENNDARHIGFAGCQEIAKIKVMSEENDSVAAGFVQYLRIAQPVKAFLVEVYCLVPKMLQEAHRLG